MPEIPRIRYSPLQKAIALRFNKKKLYILCIEDIELFRFLFKKGFFCSYFKGLLAFCFSKIILPGFLA